MRAWRSERASGAKARSSRAYCVAAAWAAACAVGCGGAAPLMHPAQTLAKGDLRVASGVAAQVTTGAAARELRAARARSSTDPGVPGAPGSDPSYARGALVAAAIAPGISPFLAARVGLGSSFEAGLAYTGRSARLDVRRSFELSRSWAFSAGLGASTALYGRQQESPLVGLDLGRLRGYGADVPILVGWESDAGLYRAWLGARAGLERDTISTLTSEPKDVTLGLPPIRLEATRAHAGGVVGLAAGFRHVHVAVELEAGYQSVRGTFNDTRVSLRGVTLAPATALLWTF